MSDVQQGPGWWLASDGKWYPPESRPQPLPPPPMSAPPGASGPAPFFQPQGAQPAPTYGQPMYGQPTYGQPGYAAPGYGQLQRRSVSAGLSGTIQGFFWAAFALSVLASLLAVVSLVAYTTYWGTPINSQAEAEALTDWVDIDDAFEAASGSAGVCLFVLFVLLIIWANSAHKATQQLWPGDRTWSSGWTVGAWFIPLANAILPKLVLNEIERIALEPRSAGTVAPTWRKRSLLAIGNLWWIGLVVGLLVTQIGNGVASNFDSSDGEVRASYILSSLGLLITGVSSLFGALYVRRLGHRLSATGMQLEP